MGATWQGTLGISAGIGNGVGVFVAGLFAATHGYSFAFSCQASVLGCLCIAMCVTPPKYFEYGRSEEKGSMAEDCKKVISNSLWRNTQLSLSLSTFCITGVSYLWQNT